MTSTNSKIKMTEARKLIMRILSEATDHPNVEQLHKRVQKLNPKIGLATIYRTVRLLEEMGLIAKLEFREGRARYENVHDKHHDHLIDIRSGKIIEFTNTEVERLQEAIAKKYGYKIVGHKLELYCVPLSKKNSES